MSDLTLTTLIVALSVIAGLLTLLYLAKRAENADVAKLLPRLKCLCGCTSLLWKGESWGVDVNFGPELNSMPDCDLAFHSVENQSGFIFKCPQCQRALWFDQLGELYKHTANS